MEGSIRETLNTHDRNSSLENGRATSARLPSRRRADTGSAHAIRVDYSAYYVVAPILSAIIISVVLMRVFKIDADYMGYCGGFLGFVCGVRYSLHKISIV
jgi:hypothetical protein